VDIVIVGGPHSGVGKTLACERAVRALCSAPVGALKLTVADGEREPEHDHGAFAQVIADAAGVCGRGASCGVCETVSARIPSRLITAPGAIKKPGTDTCRLHDAGAVAVAWVIALRSGAPHAVAEALAYLERAGARTVVIEGTTALEWLRPSASVMVATHPGKKWKDVALRHVGTCDIVLCNLTPLPAGDLAAPPQFWAAQPLACNLADAADQATLQYAERLRRAVYRRAASTALGAGGALTA
jgi:hypothetical protein